MFPRKKGPSQFATGAGINGDAGLDGDRLAVALAGLAKLPSSDASQLFATAVRLLADAYRSAYALIATYEDETRSRLHTVAIHAHDEPARAFGFDLAGSPCADVLAHDSVFVARDVAVAYPHCQWLTELEVSAFFGAALIAPSGERLGVLIVADPLAVNLAPNLQPLLPIFAERLAQEVKRKPLQHDLQLAASLFDHAPNGVMITDAEHRVIKVNPAFSTITGWQPADVLGRRDSMLSAGRDDPSLRADMQAALDEGGLWIGELWSRRNDGEVFPENRTVVAVRDPAGQVLHYLALFSDISAEKFAAERIHRLAHYDATTELPNRVLLQDRLLHAINQSVRAGTRLALLFLDLDGFKLINDSLGHAAGDEVLRLVGVRLCSRLRKADVVARVGGDEFAVVLSEVGQDSDIQLICDQLLQVVTEPYELGGQHGSVTTSIGIAVYPEDGDDVQTLLKHADAAMYQAKERGKNRYVFYEPEMNKRAEERLQLTRHLRQAMDREQFSLCYQPQYDLWSGELIGVEALVRWRMNAATWSRRRASSRSPKTAA